MKKSLNSLDSMTFDTAQDTAPKEENEDVLRAVVQWQMGELFKDEACIKAFYEAFDASSEETVDPSSGDLTQPQQPSAPKATIWRMGENGRRRRQGMRPTGPEVLEMRTLMSAPTGLPAPQVDLAALEAQLKTFPSDSDLARQEIESDKKIALLKAELATAKANAPLPIDTAEWPNDAIPFPGGGSFAMDQKGTMLAMTSQGGQPKIIDIATRKELVSLDGHDGQVTGMAFSPKGDLIATISHDRRGRIFDVKTGKLLDTIALNGLGSAVTFTPDGKAVFTVNGQGTVVYDTVLRKIVAEFPGGSPVAPVFTSDGGAAFFVDEAVVGRVDMKTGMIQSLNPGIDRIKAIDISSDGTIAIGSVKGTIILMDQTLKTITTIPGNPPVPVNGLKFIGPYRFLVFADSMKNFIYSFGAAGGGVTIEKQWSTGGYPVIPTVSASFERAVAVVLADNPRNTTITLFKTGTRGPVTTGRPMEIIRSDLTTAETQRAAVDKQQKDKQILQKKIKEEKAREAAALAAHIASIEAFKKSAGLPAVAPLYGAKEGVATTQPSPIDAVKWNTKGAPTGSLGTMPFPGEGNRGSVAMDPEGRVMVTTSERAQPIVTEVATGRELGRLNGHSQGVSAVAINQDGTRIVTGSYDGKGRIFNREGKPLDTIEFRGIIAAIRLMPDGNIAFSINEQVTKIWDPVLKKIVGEFPGGSAVAPIFTGDEKAIFADDVVVGSVDLKSGAIRKVNLGSGRVKTTDVDPSGKTIAAGSVDGTVVLLHRETLKIIATIPGEGRGSINGLTFNGMNRIVVCYDNGDIIVYDSSQIAQGLRMPVTQLFHVNNGFPVRPYVSRDGKVLIVQVLPDKGQETVIAAFPMEGPQNTEVQRMKPPMLEAVSIQGSTIILAVSSGFPGMNSVEFSGLHDGGIFTGVDFPGSTDGSVMPVSLSINGGNVSGDYAIVLLTSGKQREVLRIGVHWDKEARTLSLIGGAKLWAPPAESGPAMQEIVQQVQALKSAVTGNLTLAGFQQTELIEGVRRLPAPYGTMIPDFQTVFWKAFPELHDDRIHGTAQRTFDTQNSKFTLGQIYEGLVRGRNAAMADRQDAYRKFYDLMGSLLLDALNVLSQIQSGGPERILRSDFEGKVNDAASAPFMIRLSDIGIGLPRSWVILEAVQKVWEKQWQKIVSVKADEGKVEAKQKADQEKTTAGLVQLAGGQWVAKIDARVQPLYVDTKGRPVTPVRGRTPETVLVATRNTVTDVLVGGGRGEGGREAALLTTTQLSDYMRTNRSSLKNHLSAAMNSQNDAQATFMWLENHASLVADDYLSQSTKSSFNEYFTKLFTDIGAGLVSVVQDERVATGPGTTLLDPAQRGKLNLLHIDPNAGETQRKITALAMMLTPLGAPQRLGTVIGDFKNWEWSLAHGAKTALDVLATTGDVIVIAKGFSVSLRGIATGAEAFTASQAKGVILNVTVNGEKATIHGLNLMTRFSGGDVVFLKNLLDTTQNVNEVTNWLRLKADTRLPSAVKK